MVTMTWNWNAMKSPVNFLASCALLFCRRLFRFIAIHCLGELLNWIQLSAVDLRVEASWCVTCLSNEARTSRKLDSRVCFTDKKYIRLARTTEREQWEFSPRDESPWWFISTVAMNQVQGTRSTSSPLTLHSRQTLIYGKPAPTERKTKGTRFVKIYSPFLAETGKFHTVIRGPVDISVVAYHSIRIRFFFLFSSHYF